MVKPRKRSMEVTRSKKTGAVSFVIGFVLYLVNGSKNTRLILNVTIKQNISQSRNPVYRDSL